LIEHRTTRLAFCELRENGGSIGVKARLHGNSGE
jgi:hypothetical protein